MYPATGFNWNTGFNYTPPFPTKYVEGHLMPQSHPRVIIEAEELTSKLVPLMKEGLAADMAKIGEIDKQCRRRSIDRFWTAYYETLEVNPETDIPKYKEPNTILHLLLTSYMEATQFPSSISAFRSKFIGFVGVVDVLIIVCDYFLNGDELEARDRECIELEKKQFQEVRDEPGNPWERLKSQTETVENWCEDNYLPDLEWVWAVEFICSEIVQLVRGRI